MVTRMAELLERNRERRRVAVVMRPTMVNTYRVQLVECTCERTWKPDSLWVQDAQPNTVLLEMVARSISCFPLGKDVTSHVDAEAHAPGGIVGSLPLDLFRTEQALPFDVPMCTPAERVTLKISGPFRAVVLAGPALFTAQVGGVYGNPPE